MRQRATPRRGGLVARRPGMTRLATLVVGLVLLLQLAACGTTASAYRDAEMAVARGNYDTAIALYLKALEEDPDNAAYLIGLRHARMRSSEVHLADARVLWRDGDTAGAAREFEFAIQLDPTNQLARTEYSRLRREMEAGQESLPPDRYLEEIQGQVTAPPTPELAPGEDELFDVSIYDTPVQEIYRTLGRIGGVNILFDEQVLNEPSSFVVTDVGFQQALDLLSVTHGHFYKVVNGQTLLVIPNTPEKREQYEDSAVRTFYLSYGTADVVGDALSQILETASIVTTDELNAITVRDSPERLARAGEIVRRLDKARGEVMLEVEVLEASRRVMQEYGISLSDYTVTQNLAQGEEGAGISLNDLRYVDATDWFFQLPAIRYELMKEEANFRLLAQPRLRVSEGNDTHYLVGERVPVVSTTFSTTQTVGGNVVPFSSTTYEEVGIVMNVTPRIHHNREVTLELELEISSVARIEQVTDQLALPVFSTREVTTVLRLREGETNVLAGLLQDEERTGLTGLPWLSEVPVVGSLFGAHEDEVQQTDVILSITPHILQTSEITPEDLAITVLAADGRLGSLAGSGGPATGPAGGAPAGPAGAAQQQPAAGEAPGPTPTAQVLMLPAQQSATQGQELRFDVMVDEATDLHSAGLTINWDPSFLEYVDVTEGDLLSRGGVDATLQPSSAGRGRLTLTARRPGDVAGVSGGGRLVTVVFRAVGPGEVLLDLQGSVLQSGSRQVIPAQFWGARVTIQEPSP